MPADHVAELAQELGGHLWDALAEIVPEATLEEAYKADTRGGNSAVLASFSANSAISRARHVARHIEAQKAKS